MPAPGDESDRETGDSPDSDEGDTSSSENRQDRTQTDDQSGEPEQESRPDSTDETTSRQRDPDAEDEQRPQESTASHRESGGKEKRGGQGDKRQSGQPSEPQSQQGRNSRQGHSPSQPQQGQSPNQEQHRQPNQPQHPQQEQHRQPNQPQHPQGQHNQSRQPPGQNRQNKQEESGDSWQLFARDIITSVVAVLLIGAYLFAISGVWPPMVAIESGSMEPHMNKNDLVFVMDENRFQPSEATGETGVVTKQTGTETDYREFGNTGDVIVFQPNGNERRTPVIHRAMFWVEEGENWVAKANKSHFLGKVTCEQLRSCPADHAGFITKGDHNRQYDQAGQGATNDPVKPEWIVGTAELRIPKLGWLRLQFQS